MAPDGSLGLGPLVQYRSFARSVVRAKRDHFRALDPAHRARLPALEAHFEEMERCVDANADFLDAVLAHSAMNSVAAFPPAPRLAVTGNEVSLAVFRSLIRDWSTEGAEERRTCYDPILDRLRAHFGSSIAQRRVLVPGAGLGRLAFDIAREAAAVEAGDLSSPVVASSAYMLHCVRTGHQHTIFPFIHNLVNARERQDLVRPVIVPDVHISANEASVLSLRLVDFAEAYASPEAAGRWDAVVTCFFIDTARNVLQYIDTIHNALAPGGLWLNVGPLSWHWAAKWKEPSVELAWDDLRNAILMSGFSIVEESEREGTYTGDPRSLMQQRYTSIILQAVKPP